MVACFVFLAIAFAAEQKKTRRVVNGKTVDLKPIFEWEDLRSALGARSKSLPPRPMPHWERIAAEIFEDGNPNGIAVRTSTFIVIKNLPPPRRRVKRGVWKKGDRVNCLAVQTGLTNYVTAQKIPALVYDHGREID